MSDSALKNIFIGSKGLRAGWRLLAFAGIAYGLAAATGLVIGKLGGQVELGGLLKQLTPLQLGEFEGTILFFSGVAAWIMGKIEGRKFGQYGLPWKQALRKDFWVGLVWGFLATSGTLLAIFVLHGVRITGIAIHGTTILQAAAAWGLAFLIVGLSEEFAFRGYAQFTLTTGIGFWPSAFVISALFGLAHAGNGGENVFGELSVVLFGLLFCLFLRRTGNLWWAVGFHMGYDWGQTFFYGVSDSGLLPYHNLFIPVFSGPRWLTGGTVGPEASVFTPITLLIVAVLFSRRNREATYVTPPAAVAR
ncbi:MAG: CPBP family intramembrane glutamic endopeptidase [Terriglobales bacterium]